MLTNAEIKHLCLLKDKSGREAQGKFLIEGRRAVSEALANSGGIENLIVNSAVDSSKLADVLSQAEELHIVIEEVPDVKFSKLSSTGTSQGIVAIATMRTISVEDTGRGGQNQKKRGRSGT